MSNNKTTGTKIIKLCLSALFLAIGLVLPFLTAQIPTIGKMLLPMHIPVMLCGLVCSWQYGLAVGAILPLFRFALFGMPAYPNCIWQAFELAAYGFAIGFIYSKLKNKNIISAYISLIISMLFGRIVWGIVKTLVMLGGGGAFTFAAFIAGGFTSAIPGIILQLVLIPPIFTVLEKIVLKKLK